MRVWFLIKMIKLCDICLSFSDGADDQGEVNEVIKAKNYFLRELEDATNTNT